MALLDIIEATITAIKVIYKLAVLVYQSENVHKEIRDAARRAQNVLTTVEGTLHQWEQFAQCVSVHDETYLVEKTNDVRRLILAMDVVLNKIKEDRNFIQRLVMRTNEYKKQLSASVNELLEVHRLIGSDTLRMKPLEIHRRELTNFRTLFCNISDKEILNFQFSMVEQTSQAVSAIARKHFDPEKCTTFMKIGQEQVFISYHLRTWSTDAPIKIINEERLKYFQRDWQEKRSSTRTDNIPTADASVSTLVTIDRKLDFSEILMSSNHVCGFALTRSTIYIATEHEIKAVLLANKTTTAHYAGEGDGHKSFKRISYIYIPSNDERSLYIVDGVQCVVHQCRIDHSGHRFEYVRRYVVIANVNQKCNLISCVIYKTNLIVSDNGNNCLHIFPLAGDRQASYLIDPAINPFSPGFLCVYQEDLYIASCSATSPSILVLDELCQPKGCFRHRSLQQVLAMDIDPATKKLFILTTTMIDEERKQPLIVSIDMPLQSIR